MGEGNRTLNEEEEGTIYVFRNFKNLIMLSFQEKKKGQEIIKANH